MKVSVVISTLNRAASLRQALMSLKFQTYKDFEVIVVNGPSEDDTDAVLYEFKDDIKIGTCHMQNLSHSRNIGIGHSQGDIVAFIDDDCVTEPEWVNALVAGYDNDEVGAVGGLVYGPSGYDLQYKYNVCDRFGHPSYFDEKPSELYSFPFLFQFASLQGGNCSFRRNIILEIGGFDEEYEYYLDETDMCCRVVDAGYLIKHVNNAFVHHKHAPSAIRNQNLVMTSRYLFIKNKVYFSLKSTQNVQNISLSSVIADGLSYIEMHRRDLEYHCQFGNLEKRHVDLFDGEAQIALREGLIRGLTGSRKLVLPKRAEKYSSPFHWFRTLLNKECPLVLCFLSHCDISDSHDEITKSHHDLAFGAARLGHHVHMITLAEGNCTVDFDNGVWFHRIAPSSEAPGTINDYPVVHHGLWEYSYAAYQEVLRINSHHAVNIVQWPIWGASGIAGLSDNRFTNVVFLSWIGCREFTKTGEQQFKSSQEKTFSEEMKNIEKFCIEHVPYVVATKASDFNGFEQQYGTEIPDHKRLCLHDVERPSSSGDEDSIDPLHEIVPNEQRKGQSIEKMLQFYQRIVRGLILDCQNKL